MDRTHTRYIPTGSMKVADKHSDAVAYLYTTKSGKPAAVIYYGKQSKAVAHYSFRSEAERAAKVKAYFEGRQAHQRMQADIAEKRRTAGPGLVVGDIVNTCWGYDQTNREFYEVIEVKGKMVTIREIASERTETGWATGKCVPQSGSYKGEPMRRMARDGQVKIEGGIYASKWNTATVAGVPVGPALGWSSYA